MMSGKRITFDATTKHLTKREQSEKKTASAMIVQSAADLDKLPVDLDGAKARREWKRVVPDLKKMDIVGRLDITNLVGYCNAYSKYVEATQALREQPLTVPSPSGMKENPLVGVQIKYADLFRKFADQCGLTINSRLKWAATKMKKQEEEIESEFGAI